MAHDKKIIRGYIPAEYPNSEGVNFFTNIRKTLL